MTSIKRQSIKDQIYDILKNKIMTQEYSLGDKINMLSLASELNVSNTPIREALSMLERDGLVEMVPNAGPRVITFSTEMFNNVAEGVEALLIGSYELCLKKGTLPNLVKELERTLEIQKDIYTDSDENEFARATIAFDGAFMKCCGNKFIEKMYSELADLFYLAVLYDHWYLDPVRQDCIDEHSHILDAVKSGDEKNAMKLIKLHYTKEH